MPALPLSARLAEALLRTYSRLAPSERGSYRLVRAVRRLRPRSAWCDIFRTPAGIELDLDLATYPDSSMAYGVYELCTARLIRRLLHPGDHCIDAGANLGYFTLLAARCVGPAGRVDAFEPQPDNFARLTANLRRNGQPTQVHTHSLALLDRDAQVEIRLFEGSGFNHGCASLFDRAAASSRTAAVPGRRLDQVLAATKPKLVKIDVEGAEPLVIRGTAGLLDVADPPDIIAEYNPVAAAAAGFSPRQFIDDLLAIQPAYHVRRIGGPWMGRDLAPAQLAGLGECNLHLCCPPRLGAR